MIETSNNIIIHCGPGRAFDSMWFRASCLAQSRFGFEFQICFRLRFPSPPPPPCIITRGTPRTGLCLMCCYRQEKKPKKARTSKKEQEKKDEEMEKPDKSDSSDSSDDSLGLPGTVK